MKDRILTFQLDRWEILANRAQPPVDVNYKPFLIVTWDEIEAYADERIKQRQNKE